MPDRKIGIIIGAVTPDSHHISKLADDIAYFLYTNYRISVTVTAGSWTGSLLEIHNSFKEAAILFKYAYFYPHLPVITGEYFLKKEASLEQLPDSLINEFSKVLRLRNLKQVEKTLSSLVQAIQEGNYSADHCRQKLWEITRVFSVYIKDMQYKLSENEKSNLLNLFSEIGNINDFVAWITGFAERVFQWSEVRSNNRNYKIVERAVKYLSEHLDAPDLSLESVAAHVNLSPSYFSKIFKEVTGVAFTTYVTDLRLEKARDFLLHTDLPVQEICFKVGYNAPAYFIKQFKARYGFTPYDYRKQFLITELPSPN